MAGQKNHGTSRKDRQGRIADRATIQGGVVSLDQLRDEGVTRRRAAERAEAKSLHRIHRGVYTVGHRAVSRQTTLRAALLACGKGAVISHGTAAGFHGLWDKAPRLIDVTVPVEAGRKIEGIRCRRCGDPQDARCSGRRHRHFQRQTAARAALTRAGAGSPPDQGRRGRRCPQ